MTIAPKAKGPGAAGESASAALQKTFGRNLKRAREAAGLSQRALSAAAGISQRHISAIEMGTVNVSIETIAELGRHVGKTAAELLSDPQSGS